MNKLIFVNLFFIFATFCYSQEGVINYKVDYEGYEEKFYFNLFFNGSESLYESNLDSLSTRKRQQFGLPIYDEPKQVYINYDTKELIFRDPVPIDFYTVSDSLINIDWEIQKETRQIGNFTCVRAIGVFREVKYEAWFAPEIPLPYGPWKITGLPGLILKLKNEDGRLKITAYGINTEKKVDAVLKEKINEIKQKDIISIKEYVKLYNNKDKKIEAYLRSLFPRGAFHGVDKSKSNPLILEVFEESN